MLHYFGPINEVISLVFTPFTFLNLKLYVIPVRKLILAVKKSFVIALKLIYNYVSQIIIMQQEKFNTRTADLYNKLMQPSHIKLGLSPVILFGSLIAVYQLLLTALH